MSKTCRICLRRGVVRGCQGGGGKREEEKPVRRCRCSGFPAQKSKTQHTRSSFGGVRNIFMSLRLVCCPPSMRFAPPISWPNFRTIVDMCWTFLGHFLDIFWTFLGHFSTFLGHFSTFCYDSFFLGCPRFSSVTGPSAVPIPSLDAPPPKLI